MTTQETKPSCFAKTKDLFLRFVEANKRMLKKLDIFAIPKQNASDENLDYTSAIGGIFTITFVLSILFIVLYFTLLFVYQPNYVIDQSTDNYGIYDFTTMSKSQKAVYDQILGVPLNFNQTGSNQTNFDFGIFFPEYYNETLDTLFSDETTNPLLILNLTEDIHATPFQMSFSRFVAILNVDSTDPNSETYTIPLEFLQTYRLYGNYGRIYAPIKLNNYTIKANFRIDIILEFVYNSLDLNQDFTPLNFTREIAQVYFLYKQYDFNNGVTQQLNEQYFNFLPVSVSGAVSIGGCNGLTATASVLGVYSVTGLPSVTVQTLQKLTNWQIITNFYTFSDYSGSCPLNNQMPATSYDSSESKSSLAYSTPHIYQPFVISITSSKVFNKFSIVYENGLSLTARIGGFVSLVLSAFTGIAKAMNKRFFQKEIIDSRTKAIERTNLLNVKYEELDEYQRSIYLFLSSKLKRRTLKQDFEQLKKRGAPLDNQLVNEARKYKFFEKIEKDDEMLILLNDEKNQTFIGGTPKEHAKIVPVIINSEDSSQMHKMSVDYGPSDDLKQANSLKKTLEPTQIEIKEHKEIKEGLLESEEDP